jgi:hypothetical protein
MQTSYPTQPAAGRIGQLSDSSQHDIVSRVSAAKIPFGRFVSFASAGVVKLPAAATDIINTTSYAVSEGIAIENPSKESTAANTLGLAGANAPSYDIGDEIAVLKRGRCIVYSEQAVGPADPVFVRFSARGTSELVGNFRKDVDTDKASALGEKAHWVGTISAAGLVEIDIRL